MKAVEIGEKILALPQQPMDEQTSRIMLQLLVIERTKEGFVLPFELPFMTQLLQKRLPFCGVCASGSVVLFISSLCDRPGAAVLYCAALRAIAERRQKSKVSLDDLCEEFAFGFPSTEDLLKVWDFQKVYDGKGPDNWLDRAEAWQAEETAA